MTTLHRVMHDRQWMSFHGLLEFASSLPPKKKLDAKSRRSWQWNNSQWLSDVMVVLIFSQQIIFSWHISWREGKGYPSKLPTIPSFWSLLVCVFVANHFVFIEVSLLIVSHQWHISCKMAVVPKANNGTKILLGYHKINNNLD